MIVRALYAAAKVESAKPPYDTIHMKVLYPAKLSGSDHERMTGIVPADAERAPFPVVIFFGGINCPPEMYQWLAVKLAEQGLVVVTFTWVGETLPNIFGLTNGIDLSKVKANAYGTGPTTLALTPILNELTRLHQGVDASRGAPAGQGAHTGPGAPAGQGAHTGPGAQTGPGAHTGQGAHTGAPLQGMLDLGCVILGGHSAGGTIALQNANPHYFPYIKGVFTYAGHNMLSTMLGYAPGTIGALASAVPLLMMGGTRDGIIAASAKRYGTEAHAQTTTPIERTFDEAITSQRYDSYLVILDGANHSSMIYPDDPTIARGFLDLPTTQPDEQIRALMSDLISAFIDVHVRKKPQAAQTFERLLNDNPLIDSVKKK